MNTTFAKVLLRGVAQRMGMKFVLIDDDRDNNIILCHWVCDHFKDSSRDLRHYWIDKAIADYASKVYDEIHVVYEAYTTEEYETLYNRKLYTA